MQYESVKYNKCVRLPDSVGGVLDCGCHFSIVSPLSFDGPQLWCSIKRAFLSPSPHTCTLCPVFSLDHSVVGLAPPCTCWRKDTITRFCASHTSSTWSAFNIISQELVFFSFLYIKCFELDVEFAFNNRFVGTHHEETAGLESIFVSLFSAWSTKDECDEDCFSPRRYCNWLVIAHFNTLQHNSLPMLIIAHCNTLQHTALPTLLV